METLRSLSCPWRLSPHLHGRVSVAQRAGIGVHVITNNGRRVTERHDRHGIGDGRRDAIGSVIEAGIISQAGRIAPLPLERMLVMNCSLGASPVGTKNSRHTLAQARSTLAWCRKKSGSLGEVAGPMSPKMTEWTVDALVL